MVVLDSSNVTNTIMMAINEIFAKIFASIDNDLYAILDDFTFIDSTILDDKLFHKLFGMSAGDGILLIANSLIFGFLIYYGFRLLFSHLGITEAERPSKFIFKLIVFGICMNFSFFICEQIIQINSYITIALRTLGEMLYSHSISFSVLITKLNTVVALNENTIDIFSLNGILKSLVSFGILNLAISYAVRYILIKIFVLISPFAIISLSVKSSSVFFKAWLKSLISLLFIQDFIAIVLLLIFSLNLSSSNLFSKFVLVSSIFILIKSNHYVKELLGGISTDVSMGIQGLKSLFNR